jgi:nucleoid-associated protein YgaU
MHLPHLRPALALLAVLALAPIRGLADEPHPAPPPLAAAVATTPSDGVASTDSDTESKLAGALRSFTLVQNENDQLQAKNDKLVLEKADLESQVAALKNAVPVAAQAQSLREQLRQTQGQLAALAEENARLRTAIALSGPAPGALPAPITTRVEAPMTPVSVAPDNPKPAASDSPSAAPKTHTVVAGDTLSKISLKYYGTTHRWPDILAANKDTLKNENSLVVGKTIRLP